MAIKKRYIAAGVVAAGGALVVGPILAPSVLAFGGSKAVFAAGAKAFAAVSTKLVAGTKVVACTKAAVGTKVAAVAGAKTMAVAGAVIETGLAFYAIYNFGSLCVKLSKDGWDLFCHYLGHEPGDEDIKDIVNRTLWHLVEGLSLTGSRWVCYITTQAVANAVAAGATMAGRVRMVRSLILRFIARSNPPPPPPTRVPSPNGAGKVRVNPAQGATAIYTPRDLEQMRKFPNLPPSSFTADLA